MERDFDRMYRKNQVFLANHQKTHSKRFHHNDSLMSNSKQTIIGVGLGPVVKMDLNRDLPSAHQGSASTFIDSLLQQFTSSGEKIENKKLKLPASDKSQMNTIDSLINEKHF